MGDCDQVYAERDRLVAALSKLLPSHLSRHEGDDWEDDWRNIVCIHLPAGQATWHIHDSELPWFSHLLERDGHWDGHSTAEKYERLAKLSPSNSEYFRAEYDSWYHGIASASGTKRKD